MKTLTLHVNDKVAEAIKQLLALLPEEEATVVEFYDGIEYVSDEEQAELEELLKDPDCDVPAEKRRFTA